MVPRGALPQGRRLAGALDAKGGLLDYPQPLVEGTLLRRYKRFLADVELPGGEVVVAHCPNPGSMKSCLAERAPVRLSHHDDPKRKLAWTLEQIRVDGTWILVHTGWPNHVVAEAVEAGRVPELIGYPVMRRERRYGSRNSRIDLLLEDGARAAYVEVKNVTMADGPRGLFPDSVTARGTRHLLELVDMVAQGHRGVLFFHVGRADVVDVRPADHIDRVYGATLREAVARGVEVIAYRCDVERGGLALGERVPVIIG